MVRKGSKRLIFASVLTCVAWVTAARAQGLRVAVIIDETIEGRIPTVPVAQGEVEKGLMEKGFKLVDSKRVVAARRDASVELLVKGQLPASMTAMDADLLVAARVDATSLGTVMDSDFHVYSAGIKASLVRVSTGEILKTFTAEVRADGISKKTAARKAQRNAGRKILEEVMALLPQLKARAAKIEFVIRGVPGPARLAELKQALKSIEEITGTSSGYLSKRLSRLEVTSRLAALELAARLEKSQVPLEIMAASSGRILARWAPQRALRLELLLTAPRGGGLKRLAWLRDSFTRIALAEFENISYLSAGATEKTPPSRKRLRPEDIIKLAGGDKQVDLVALPAISRAGQGVLVSLAVFEAQSGKKICSASASGKPESITRLVHRLVTGLERKLLRAVARGRKFASAKLVSASRQARRALSARSSAPLRIASIELGDIFPARLGFYTSHPLGRIRLQASGKKAVKEVKVSVFVPGFMKLPSERVLSPPPAQSVFEVPLRVTLDPEKIFQVDENTPVQARVKISFKTTEGIGQVQRIVPLMVFDRNALSWQDPRAAAAFVTPREESLKRFARLAVAAHPPESMPAGLVKPAALFEAMRLLGIRYLKDPVNPHRAGTLDYVQYPRETLAYRTGDCDDLAVLYAALLESVGVESALVTTPGHILVAFRLDPSLSPVMRVTFDPSMYLSLDSLREARRAGLRGTAFRVDAAGDRVMLIGRPQGGQHWIPVECTSLDASFLEAWRRGAEEIGRWTKKASALAVIPVQAAWDSFPPVSLPHQEKDYRLDRQALENALVTLAGQLQKELTRSRDERLARLKNRISRRRGDMAARAEAAMLLSRSGRLPQARKLLEKARRLAPGNPGLANNLGNVLLMAGEYDRAIKLYRRSLSLDASLAPLVYANLALAYVVLGDDDLARKAMAESLRHGGADIFAAMGLLPGESSSLQAGDHGLPEKKLSERMVRRMLRQVLEKAAKSPRRKTAGRIRDELFANPLPSAGRRGDDPQRLRLLGDCLRWVL